MISAELNKKYYQLTQGMEGIKKYSHKVLS